MQGKVTEVRSEEDDMEVQFHSCCACCGVVSSCDLMTKLYLQLYVVMATVNYLSLASIEYIWLHCS